LGGQIRGFGDGSSPVRSRGEAKLEHLKNTQPEF